MQPLAGIIPILATPFHDDETLDLDSWRRMIEFVIGLGVDGITVAGVLGEANRLTDRERRTLIEAAARTVNGRVALIAGASHSGTAAAAELARMAADAGATAVMIAPQSEPVPNEERIVETYARIAASSPLPIVLQDHPASTGVHMGAPLIARIVADVPAVAAIKAEAVPTAPKIRALKSSLSRKVPILAGLGALYAPFDLAAGADGFNTGFAFPEVLQALLVAQRAGEQARIDALYARFTALIVFEQQPGVAIRKEILKRRGLFSSSCVRHPGAKISPALAESLGELLERTFPGADIRAPIAP
jgi:4-hydroxy-tetrahydrodipicolinate synthase